MIESDYADDLYDMLIGFFDEHNRYPHFLKCERLNNACKISFESTSEFFLIDGADDEQMNEFAGLVDEYNR